jgi:quinol monooxygenase YgiN
MAHLLVRHTVEDYARWRPYFDQHEAARRTAGSQGAQVFQSAANPNEITILMEWDSLENAQAFAQSPDLREIMQKAGVMGMPDVQFLSAASKSPA